MTTPPPGLTRFKFQVRMRNGSKTVYFQCDVDQIIIPEVGQSSLGLDPEYGLTTEVQSVDVYPTADPTVYVNGRTVVVEEASEMTEIIHAAKKYGWKVR